MRKQIDVIRQYIIDTRIITARRNGDDEVTVRAGTISKEMMALGLLPSDHHRMPNICGALDSLEEHVPGIRLIHRNGPEKGSTTEFKFHV